MSLLTITDLTLRIAGRPLLEGASLTIDAGQHVGLIGRNGAGKSTLLAAIYGDIAPDSGVITRAQRTSIGRVKQETPSGERSLLETVLESHQERATLLHQSETLTDPIALSDIHERLIAIDAHTAPARASAILSGLGFDYDAQQRPVSDFSGGWRMRVALASALFLSPDLLLLDEPTNHLDIEATLWLESWLKKFSGTVLMVSHDRALLDHCVNHIAHLDKGKLSLTPGGYDRFIQIKTEQALQQNRAAQKISEQRAKMEDFVRRFRAKATKARQAQARLKALARLPQIDYVIEEAGTEFSFPSPSSLPPPMITLEDVSTGYGEKIILKSLSLRLDIDDRIALLGRNGHGKSTFAKLLSGEILPIKGQIHASNKLRIGYFAQHQNDALIASDTPIAHMSRALPNATPTEIRAQLARFGLTTERAETKINALSGGEKARLLLSLATRHAPHLLILDEPTNHLDLDARDALIRALCNFEGAVILISHDSHLVESVADTLWIADNQTITPFEGDMNDYKTWLDQRAKEAQKDLNKRKITSQSSHQQEREDDPSNKMLPHAQKKEILKEQTRKLAPLRRKIRDLEATMEKLTTKKHKIEEKLADPDLYQSGKAEDITLLNTKRASLEKELEEIEILWLDAQDNLETQMSL